MTFTLLSAGAAIAEAETLRVSAAADSDSGDCVAAPCATLGYAVGEAEAGDAIEVAAGAYPLAATVVVDKAVRIAGAQAGVDARNRDLAAEEETVLEPDGVFGTPLVRLGAPGAELDGLTIEGHTQAGVQMSNTSSGYAVRNSILTGSEVGIDLETTALDAEPTVIERNRFEANNQPTLRSGIYGDGAADAVTIRDNRFLEHENVPINLSGSTTTQRDIAIVGNRFEAERHVLLLDADGVEVTGNTFLDGRSQAISVEGGVRNLTISGNAITDTDNAGVIFFDRYGAGPNEKATIAGNTILGTAPGDLEGATGAAIDVSNQWSGEPGYLGELVVRGNRLVGNAGGGVVNDVAGATVDAADNWWGCNAGPGAAGCDAVAGPVEAGPHLVLSGVALPGEILTGGEAAVVASLASNSAGQPAAAAPDGTPVGFAASLGALSVGSATLRGGSAEATLSAGEMPGDAGLVVSVDNQVVPVGLSVVAPPPPPPPAPPAPASEPPAAPPAVVPVGSGTPKAVTGGGQVVVATVACEAASCEVRASKPQLTVAGRTFKVRVRVPAVLGSGSSARVRVVLPKKAREALAKRGKGRVRLTLIVTGSDGSRRTVRVTVAVKPGKQDKAKRAKGGKRGSR